MIYFNIMDLTNVKLGFGISLFCEGMLMHEDKETSKNKMKLRILHIFIFIYNL